MREENRRSVGNEQSRCGEPFERSVDAAVLIARFSLVFHAFNLVEVTVGMANVPLKPRRVMSRRPPSAASGCYPSEPHPES